jgi:tetratricopeptide (TPR) repeat protein
MGGFVTAGGEPFKKFHRELYATVFRHFAEASNRKFAWIAGKVECDVTYIYAIKDGTKLPSLRITRKLDPAIDAGGLLIQIRQLIDRLETTLRVQAHTGGDPASDEEDDMERRRLLQSLAALGITISPFSAALENIRRGVDQALGAKDTRHVDDWESTVHDYGYAYLTSPPQQLAASLAADLVAVQAIMDELDADDPRNHDWSRVTGGLTTLMAAAVSNLGDARAARQWWGTALRAADASGDLDLRMHVREKRIIYGLYERRPLPMLLQQAQEAESLAKGHACAGLAGVRAGRAQMLAHAGQAEAARAELRRVEEVFGRLPATVTGGVATFHGWAETRLRFTETWVNAYLGRTDEADTAAGQALKLYPSEHRAPIQIGLLQALGRVKGGDITEGVRHAQTVYTAAPSEQRINMIRDTARRVVQHVPRDQRDRPEVTALHELVA